MKKRDSLLLILCIIALLASIVFASFAYLKVKENYIGNFEVKLETEGVDIFEVVEKKDCYINAVLGKLKDVTATGSIGIKLTTTKNQDVTYCYKANVELPSEKVFSYTSSTPDLILNVYTETNGVKDYIINEMDITEATGKVDVNKIFEVTASKNSSTTTYLYADIAFLYKPLDQEINVGKTYKAKLNAYVVDCKTGESVS